MTAPDDLVSRLRSHDRSELAIGMEAADEIEQLRERVAELEAENALLKERLEVQFKRLTSMDGLLANAEAERDKALADIRIMVEKAAANSLDGYRELGAKCAALEAERDALRADAERYQFLRRFDHFQTVDLLLDTREHTTLDSAVDAAREKP